MLIGYKTYIVGALAVLGAAAYQRPPGGPPGGGFGGPPGGGPGGGFGPGMFLAPRILELADTNTDDKLSPEEAAKAAGTKTYVLISASTASTTSMFGYSTATLRRMPWRSSQASITPWWPERMAAGATCGSVR